MLGFDPTCDVHVFDKKGDRVYGHKGNEDCGPFEVWLGGLFKVRVFLCRRHYEKLKRIGKAPFKEGDWSWEGGNG